MEEFLKDLFIDLYENFTEIFLNILVLVIVMLGGIVVSWLIRKLLEKVLMVLRFDRWAQDAGVANFLEKGGVKSSPSIILSKIVYWIFIISFLSFGLNFIGVTQFSEYALRISNALPVVVASVVIIIIGIIFSNFMGRLIFMTCENANIKYGDIIAKAVRIFLIIITFGIVFEYIGIGNTIITVSFLIVFGGVIMALSLALGIGLSHVIGDFIKDHLRTRNEKKEILK
ncbi:MAG: hypothetical protein NZ583_02565 [Desulfobacterota bacterium]|nr:hypothetical protein [Thermodesulfobacteriota bacterium]MDW8001768.1 hypothetical protein [Deltaproteobacteria bacterium]